jgi:peptidyl-prolyl cis-trans isomerase A (cyclophilin A)
MNVPRVSKSICLVAVACLVMGCENGGTQHDPAIPAVDTAAGALPEKCPAEYWVKFDTTRGPVVIEVHRAWSPYGADRFYELVKSGFYDHCKFFRVVNGFVVQFGISGDPRVSAKWADRSVPDDQFKRRDPDQQSNKRAYVTFAKSAMPNSRTTQVFINCVGNERLDAMGFTPFGVVLSGMAAIDSLYSGYGEEPTGSQDRIQKEGDTYLNAAFPRLDSIKTAVILPGKPAAEEKKTDDGKKPDGPPPNAGPPAAPK